MPVELYVVGELIDAPPWIPMRQLAEGECPQCGYEGPHPMRQNEDGVIHGQCQECYAIFTIKMGEPDEETAPDS